MSTKTYSASPHTVCILTSGVGSRMGGLTKNLNKALLPVNKKAAISHIIGRFPDDTNFIISIGYLGSQVQNYLEVAHPDLNINYVKVENFSGSGSGPAHSLECCQKFLQKPFFFVSCDTLWFDEFDFPLDSDWVAYSKIPKLISESYCNLKIQGGLVTEIYDKMTVGEQDFGAFTGLCFVKNYEDFWTDLSKGKPVSGERQISCGFASMIKESRLRAILINWCDIGTEDRFKSVTSSFQQFDFSKLDECLYLDDLTVIKFFTDENITRKRVEKARLKSNLFPKISAHKGQFYSYKLVAGSTLYEFNNHELFEKLLDWLKNEAWTPVEVQEDSFASACRFFYKDKTMQRIEMFNEKYPSFTDPTVINGELVAPFQEIISQVDWEYLSDGLPHFIHGDLQFDNILCDPLTGKFTLIDWRQDFAGHVNVGDMYYDLAKLYGGILMNYDLIKRGVLSYSQTKNLVNLDFGVRNSTSSFITLFETKLASWGLELQKVKLIAALIFLNMAPLHHFPFDQLLFSFGKHRLARALEHLSD